MRNHITEMIVGIIAVVAIIKTGHYAVIGICVVLCMKIIAKALGD